MSESDQDNICRKCSQPKQKVGSGRLTEWIKVCTCNINAPAAPEEPPVELCPTCGKRIAVSRSGSFTQWIFRPDYCGCSKPPTGKTATANGAAAYKKVTVPDEISLEEQKRLEEQYGDRIPLERYRMISELGRGSAGTVFLCSDLLLKKKVAIKSLNTLGNETLMAFQQEARSTSKLNHPNIVRVIDFGSIGGAAPYMVLEYFSGISVEKLIHDRGRLRLDFAVAIVLQMCDALAYSHKQKIWHRDLKPSNVMVSERDNSIDVRLIDFGIAMFKPGTDTISPSQNHQYNTLVGTPAYMSPDQALGKAFDARSEIYSLGCVFFEMLTGHPPFEADTPLEMIALHAKSDPPNLFDTITDTYGAEFAALSMADEIIQKCLEKSPDARYQSIGEFKSAVLGSDRNVLEAEPDDLDGANREVKSSGALSIALLAVVIILPCSFMLLNFALDGALLDSGVKTNKVTTNILPSTFEENIDANNSTANDYLSIAVRKNMWNVVLTTDELRVLGLVKQFKKATAVWFSSPISERVFRAVRQLKLRALALDGTQLSQKQVVQLTEIETIYLLVLLNSSLNDADLKLLSKMSNLSNLVLQSTRSTDAGLKNLSALPNLKSLALNGMKQVNDRSIDALLGFPALIGLGVPRTGITKAGAIRLIKSGKFKALDLSELNVESEVLATLKRSQLERIGLSHTKNVSPEIYDCLANMKKLEHVDLRFCPGVRETEIKELNSRRVKNGLKPCTIATGNSATYPEWDLTMYD